MSETYNINDKLGISPILREEINLIHKKIEEGGVKGEKGDKGDPGPAGPKGDKGDKGDKGAAGAGLTGSAVRLTKIATPGEATAETIATKVNEVIDQLIARGIATS